MTPRRACARSAASAALLLAALYPGCGTAAETEPVVVERHGAAFTVRFDALIDAPPRRVYQVLTDFASLRALNPAIVAASAQAAPGGRGMRVRTVLESCIWLFCRKVVQVEDVVERDPQTIVARIVPGLGDFKRGWTTWRLTEQGGKRACTTRRGACRTSGFRPWSGRGRSSTACARSSWRASPCSSASPLLSARAPPQQDPDPDSERDQRPELPQPAQGLPVERPEVRVTIAFPSTPPA